MSVGSDGFIQVAPDGTGKKLGSELTESQALDNITGIPSDVHIQKAKIVGSVEDSLAAMKDIMELQLSVLQAILQQLNATSNFSISEEDFPPQ